MRRGDVRRLRLGARRGHVQGSVRYGVVVQSDAMMRLSTILVAPTSTSARAASFRPMIEVDGTPTRVLVEQTGAVDVTRLGERIDLLTPDEQWGVDLALATVLDLRQS